MKTSSCRISGGHNEQCDGEARRLGSGDPAGGFWKLILFCPAGRLAMRPTRGFELSSLLGVLPPVSHAVAYGSGVFEQLGSAAVSKTAKVVDYILAVDDAVAWHEENLMANPVHYGRLSRAVGGRNTVALADSVGLGVHFNPYVKVGAQLCKYGIVSKASLLRDLTEWENIYLAGRLHKPVRTLVESEEVAGAVRANARAALCAALLLLPREFTRRGLYLKICALSYEGDIRLAFAEDRSKVSNIVSGSEGELDRMYLGELRGDCGAMAGVSPRGSDSWTQEEGCHSSRAELLACLPGPLLHDVSRGLGLVSLRFDTPESRRSSSATLARETRVSEILEATLASRVRQASLRQAAYGFLTTDPVKSAYYLGQKLHKAFLSWHDKKGKRL